MKQQGTLLVVDDNTNILLAVKMLMQDYFKEVITIPSPNRIAEMLREKQPDVVLLDMNFTGGINSGNEGLFWLREIKKTRPSTHIILFTAYADINLAVTGMKDGAEDFIVKPFENAHLIETLTSFTKEKSNKKKDKVEEENENGCEMFWGESSSMLQLRKVVERIARTDANVLITGENGTGKEMLAREIHRLSIRHKAPLVSVDMGAVSETLFESELFGHVKGAFTDAHSDRIGKFESAKGGSLFLDEIGNLPYFLQAKLLTAIQRRCITKVGSNNPIDVDIRLICATNKNLQEMVNKNEFREDLLYRINTIHLELPSLKERSKDIPALAQLFLNKYSKYYSKPNYELSSDACEKLSSQPWPGNIRELEHTIEKAVIMNDKQRLGADDFDIPKVSAIPESPFNSKKGITPTTLEEMECEMIKATLKECNGNMSMVAQQLGITRQTLYNKLKRYGL